MTAQQITISLPEAVLRQLMRIAEATNQPIESLIAQSVLNNLPPSTDNAPPELQPELLEMQTLSIGELLAIAQSQIDPAQYEYHTELLRKNEGNQITTEERQELSRLRQSADRMMLRKAYSYSILRWRGHRIILEELPIPV